MSDNQQHATGKRVNINISGQVSAEENIMIGVGNLNRITNNNGPSLLPIDLETLKKSLVELYGHLPSAGLPAETQMELQASIYQSKKLLEGKEPPNEEVANTVKKIGESLQQANVAIEHGSQLASTVVKMAAILGPVVVGGAKVVASWFGVPLP